MADIDIFKEDVVATDWREIVALTDDLPPMPNVAWKAMELLENENVSGQELSKILSKDTALVSRVLRIANSAMFARQREISTISQASMVIGYKTLKGIIYAATVRQMYSDMTDAQSLVWEHSVATAMFSTKISEFLNKPYQDEAFLLGMLHSLGQLALLNFCATGKKFDEVLKLIKSGTMGEYFDAEQKVFGFSHALIGALVAKKWNFPLEICQIILHYLDPIENFVNKDLLEEKTLLVRLSSILAHKFKIGSPEGYRVVDKEIIQISEIIGFNKNSLKSDLDKVCNDVRESFKKEKNIY